MAYVLQNITIGSHRQNQATSHKPKSCHIRYSLGPCRRATLIGDPSGQDVVDGKAFLIVYRNQEEAHQVHDTDKYELVRCEITVEMDGVRIVKGLTFRFLGEV